MLHFFFLLGAPYPHSSAPDTPQVEAVRPNEGPSTRNLSTPHTGAQNKPMPPRDNRGLWTADYLALISL